MYVKNNFRLSISSEQQKLSKNIKDHIITCQQLKHIVKQIIAKANST